MSPRRMTDRAVLVAPGPFDGLRAPEVAAALGRGLEGAGITPELCPVSGGGAGTIEVLLPAVGGETGAGFAALEDGATVLVECADDAAGTARRLRSAVGAGPAVVVLAAADAGLPHAAAALEAAGDLGGARAVVLRGAGAREEVDLPAAAVVEQGARFVLDALGIDPRLRAARAVIVGTGRLDERALRGGVEGELAVRARQAGVPCHAVVGEHALDAFEARMLDLQRIVEAPTAEAIEGAAARLVDVL